MVKNKLTETQIQIAKDYLYSPKTAKQIANEYNVSIHNVRWWAKKYNRIMNIKTSDNE